MAYRTTGVRLITRYYCFFPAIVVGLMLLQLRPPWAPLLLFFNHVLFVWGAGQALKPSRDLAASLYTRIPAMLLWQSIFGAAVALLVALPLALAWQDRQPVQLAGLTIAVLIFVALGLKSWPAHGTIMAQPWGPSGNPLAAAIRGFRTATGFTRSDLERTIEGLPVLAAVLLLSSMPWVYYYLGGELSPSERALFAGAYLLLLAPWVAALVFAEADKLVLSRGHDNESSDEDKDAHPNSTQASKTMRPFPRYRKQNFEHPLMVAAADCDLSGLAKQVELGVDLGQISENGSNPLAAVVRSQRPERLEVIGWLLSHGVSVIHADADGNCALHFACYLGDLEAARLLVQHGAGFDLDNNDHLAPLAAACAAGNWPVAELLIERGANINPSHGIPPLHATAMLGHDDPLGAEMLIKRGAQVNYRGKLGRTALMGAAMKGNTIIAELLLKSGADINARDDFGNTALMEAARSGANAVLERFVLWQPDTDYRDKPGRTALLVAVSSRRADPDTIRLLMAMGADPHVRNREGREAGDLASAAGRWRVAKALGYEPVLGRKAESGALTATQALARVENEDEAVLIDISAFESKADTQWALRQSQGRSRTQLESATSITDAPPPPEAAPSLTAAELLPAGDPDWPEPGELAGRDGPREPIAKPADLELTDELQASPQFELVPEELPVPSPRDGASAAGNGDGETHIPAEEPQQVGDEVSPAMAEASLAELSIADPPPPAAEEPLADVTPAGAEPGPEEQSLDSAVDLGDADSAALDERVAGVYNDRIAAEPGEQQLGYKALIEAATSDDIDQLKVVILSQEEVPEWWLAAAFLNSVAHGRIMAPRWLLDNGLSPNASSEGGQSLLECVVEQSPTPVDTICLLLDREARAGPDGRHLLWISGFADHEHQAVEELGSELEEQLAELLPRLINAGASLNARDALGRSPSHWAIRYRGVKYLQALLDAGSDVDAVDEGGNSVLMDAVECRRACQMGIIRTLIKGGADPRRQNNEGVSPISRAMESGDDSVLKLLMLGSQREAAAPSPPPLQDDLIGAAADGNLGRVKRLLARRVDVNERDSEGCTALLRASGSGHASIVAALIAAGAAPNIAAGNRTTPLGAAVLGHHLEIVRLLIDRGVEVDQPQQFGISPLMLAAACWHPRMVRLLLKLGAQIDRQDDAEGTALMAAAQNAMHSSHVRKGQDTLKILLDGGADVNAVNDEKQSVLMLLLGVRARETQSVKVESLVPMVRLLIDAGADLDAQDLTGWCALHAAAAHGFLEPARELLAAGANKRLRDINGLSPCDLAMDHSNDRMVDLFLAS